MKILFARSWQSADCSPFFFCYRISVMKSNPWAYCFVLSGTLQSSRKPLAHRVSHGNQKEAPRLCRLPGHDLLCWRARRHHGAEQRREIQPQDQPVVPCSRHDVQAEWGVCAFSFSFHFILPWFIMKEI